MTKQEIIEKGQKKFPPDIIEEIEEDGSIVQTDVNATVRYAYIQGLIDNNCPLPSDIEEAAEKCRWEIEEHCAIDDRGNPLYSECDVENAFKAGAEWNDKQYHKIEGDLVDWYETKGVDYCCGIRTEGSFEVPAGFYIKKKI